MNWPKPFLQRAGRRHATSALGIGAVILLSIGCLPSCPTTPPVSEPELYTYEIVASYPHDPQAFTQGLAYDMGLLYEGTGIRGASSLRRVNLETGEVVEYVALPPAYFGEGIAVVDNRVLQLTWQSQVGFIYDKATLSVIGQFSYPGEGWGLTYDGRRLIMSDGTATLRFLDPATFAELGRVTVHDRNGFVRYLNELEYINGRVYANVWGSDRIARIDPESGAVVSWIDLTGLLSPAMRTGGEDVLNGIAYDSANDRLFVTGKLWPLLFQIRLVPVE
jgi:glutaminyl-peptide cyclotransferase